MLMVRSSVMIGRRMKSSEKFITLPLAERPNFSACHSNRHHSVFLVRSKRLDQATVPEWRPDIPLG
jgi:hypothetical protein